MEAYLQNQALLFGTFIVFAPGMVAIELGVCHRRDHVVSVRESLIWTAVRILLSFAFMASVCYRYETILPERGTEAALEFPAGHLIEKSVSIDNVFVSFLIFSYLIVRAQYQYRVLFWGIIVALILRAKFIAPGALLIARFHAIIYLFGAFLVFTGIKMAWAKDKQIHPERNPVLRLFQRVEAVTNDYRGRHFFDREREKWLATFLLWPYSWPNGAILSLQLIQFRQYSQ